MTEAVPTAREDQTLRSVHDDLLKNSAAHDTVNYVYVLDSKRKLVGVLSVRELFSHPLSRTIGDVCKRTSLVTVHPETHQEHAAFLALKNNIKAVPVVDHAHHFLGEITSDTILRVLHKEMHEDVLKRAGIRHPAAVHASVLDLSLFMSIRHRIPWLMLGLFGGLIAAKIVDLFEVTLQKNLILAAFIPLIVYMSDAVGTQMEAYIIRDLALDTSLPFRRYFFKHLSVVVVTGAILSVVLFLAAGIFISTWHMALVLSLSLFGAVFSSVLTGLIIPYVFSRMKLDPADASGPVATIIQDMMSIVIYFGIATILL